MAKTREDLKFEAESDAHTLAEAEVIKATPARMKRARSAAKDKAAEAEKRAAGLRRVAGGSSHKSNPKSRSRKSKSRTRFKRK